MPCSTPISGGNFNFIEMIAKPVAQSPKTGAVVSKVTPSLPGERVLVIGSSVGDSAYAAASALAVEHQREIYCVDLSAVVNKYIGETEKNLSRILDQAEQKNWILFFDEADALFGKRTEVKDSHDRYANVEINYLLQQLERYKGIAVFATNRDDNIDEALLRKFQRVVRLAPTSPPKPLAKKKR
jgi:SpoVK/Ycf46/Vps4 family AAA+-type ATPase